MQQKRNATAVVFRVWKDGEVIALFPDEDAGDGQCASYMHVGQHGGALYSLVVSRTRPASRAESTPLRSELQGLGYDLVERKRRGRLTR